MIGIIFIDKALRVINLMWWHRVINGFDNSTYKVRKLGKSGFWGIHWYSRLRIILITVTCIKQQCVQFIRKTPASEYGSSILNWEIPKQDGNTDGIGMRMGGRDSRSLSTSRNLTTVWIQLYNRLIYRRFLIGASYVLLKDWSEKDGYLTT